MKQGRGGYVVLQRLRDDDGGFWARSIDGPDYLLGNLALRRFGTFWGASLL